MKLDAAQLKVKRRLEVGEVEMRLSDPAIRALRGRASYLPDQKKVRVQVIAVPAAGNRVAVRSIAIELVDWPDGSGDVDAIKTHLRAVTTRYRAAVGAHTWPSSENFTAKCFAVGADVTAGRSTRCASCTAYYCTVERG